MTKDEAIKELQRIAREQSHDPEWAHMSAEDVLLLLADEEIRAAYDSVVDACRWWAYA